METDLEKLEDKKCQCKLSRFDRVRHIFLDQMANYLSKDQQIQKLKTLTETRTSNSSEQSAPKINILASFKLPINKHISELIENTDPTTKEQ